MHVPEDAIELGTVTKSENGGKKERKRQFQITFFFRRDTFVAQVASLPAIVLGVGSTTFLRNFSHSRRNIFTTKRTTPDPLVFWCRIWVVFLNLEEQWNLKIFCLAFLSITLNFSDKELPFCMNEIIHIKNRGFSFFKSRKTYGPFF